MDFSTTAHRPLQANHFSLKNQHHTFQRELLRGRMTTKSNKVNAKVSKKVGELHDNLTQSRIGIHGGRKRRLSDSVEEKRIPLSNKRLLTECNSLTKVDRKKGDRDNNQAIANISSYGKFTKFSIDEICSGNRYAADQSTYNINNNSVPLNGSSEIKIVTSSSTREMTPSDLTEMIPSTIVGKERLKNQLSVRTSHLPSALDKLSDNASDSSTDLRDYDVISNCQENQVTDDLTNNKNRIRESLISEHEKHMNDIGCKGPLKRKRRIDQEERRRIANERERSRVHTLAAAFDALREVIPSFSPSQKLSKLTILKVAISYISALDSLNSRMPTVLSKNHFSDSVDACTHALKAEYGRAKRISWQDKK